MRDSIVATCTVVGEIGKGVDVLAMRRAQDEPLGDQDGTVCVQRVPAPSALVPGQFGNCMVQSSGPKEKGRWSAPSPPSGLLA